MLYDKLNTQLKEYMKTNDVAAKNVVRSIKSKITEYLVANRLPHDKVSDDIVIQVISSYKKSLEKAINQLQTGGDKSIQLISEYEVEIRFCETYLPDTSETEAQTLEVVNSAIAELGVSDMKQMGRVMGHIMKNNKGLDGKLVKKLVSDRLRG
jgi:uncharacterized protein YqeY